MNPVVDFDGFAFNYINEDHMNLTVKLVPENGVASYGDIFEVLKKSGVEADEIKGLYKVRAVDKSWSVLLSKADGRQAERVEKCKVWQNQFLCYQYGRTGGVFTCTLAAIVL